MSEVFAVLVGAFGQWVGCGAFLFVILKIQRRYLLELNRLGGRPLMLFSAAIFVPIHELSHAFMALICGHKIDKVVFFQITQTNTLGYVAHSYKKTALSPFANMLIGFAPLVGGGFFCYWATVYLMPSMLGVNYRPQNEEWVTFIDIANSAEMVLKLMKAQYSHGEFWLWAFLMVNMAIFSVPSGADFKGASTGVVFTLIFYLLLSIYAAGSRATIDGEVARGVLVVMPFLVMVAMAGGLFVGLLNLINKVLGRTEPV
mgnify:CR=1 FL=1